VLGFGVARVAGAGVTGAGEGAGLPKVPDRLPLPMPGVVGWLAPPVPGVPRLAPPGDAGEATPPFGRDDGPGLVIPNRPVGL
jgi:hypothetical protein